MLFNSYEFIFVFLPITFIVYYLLPRFGGGVKAGVVWLSFMSLCFYGYWDVRYVPLLLCSILWNFWVGRFIEHMSEHRKKLLMLGITGNLLLLGYYKYMAFFIENINAICGFSYDIPNIILPLGISFFTFTQTAYLVDAYRGETKGYSLLTYVAFVTIFPHLIAGPIINHLEMIPQFLRKERLKINYKNLALGITIFTMGLFKKVAIADNIAPWANEVFSHADNLTMLEAWIGALSYTFQLYFDFSGYSEMAIGLGLMFNLHFPINFNSPYQSSSIIDFWRRWHMTLGLWVKNYLYIPMGGNRHGQFKKMRNLLVSMLIIGFWHGAGWTFIIWGGLHGVFLVINHIWLRFERALPKFPARVITFICVMCLWVFFRAKSVNDALYILNRMVDVSYLSLPDTGTIESKFGWLANYGVQFMPWASSGLPIKKCLVLLPIIYIVLYFTPNVMNVLKSHELKVWYSIPLALLLYICICLVSNNSPFLYFQF